MGLLNLSHPELKSIFLKNNKEKVEYLVIPYNQDVDDLKQDIGSGAPQFHELLPLVMKDNSEKYIFLTTSSEELANMAVTYLAAIYNNDIPLEEYTEDTMTDEEIIKKSIINF